MTAPEFSRTVPLDRIGTKPARHTIEANEDERTALAVRFGLVTLDALAAQAEVWWEGDAMRARGKLSGAATQSCVVTGEPLPVSLTEPFDVRFIAGLASDNVEEIELDEDACETIFYEGRAIDLGEAVAQGFALALDPFPRGPNADESLREAGVIDESEAGPFGALKGLRDRMGGK